VVATAGGQLPGERIPGQGSILGTPGAAGGRQRQPRGNLVGTQRAGSSRPRGKNRPLLHTPN